MSFFYEKRDYNYEAFFVDMDFVPHMHEKIEIMYVCEGIVDTKIGNCQKIMAPGELSIAFPDVIHSYRRAGVPNYLLTVIFDSALVENYKLLLSSKQPEYPFLAADQVHPDIIHAVSYTHLDVYKRQVSM